jgi:hypothetical protein
VHSVLYNRRHSMSRKGRYGCLNLNPSGELVLCAEVLELSRPARNVACVCWPARVHHSNVRFCGQDCSDCITVILRYLKKTVTKRTKAQCPITILSTTYMGIAGIEDKYKRPRQNIFLISRKWHVFLVWYFPPYTNPP